MIRTVKVVDPCFGDDSLLHSLQGRRRPAAHHQSPSRKILCGEDFFFCQWISFFGDEIDRTDIELMYLDIRDDQYRRVVYQCNHKYKDKKHPCKTPHLTEDQIKPLFIDAVNQLYEQRDVMITAVETAIEELQNMDDCSAQLLTLSTELEELIQIAEANDRENASKVQDQAEFRERQQGIFDRIEKKKTEYRDMEEQTQRRNAQTGVLRDYLKSLKRIGDTVTEFDSLMWTRLTDFMTVYSKDDVRFTFKDGTEIRCRKGIS